MKVIIEESKYIKKADQMSIGDVGVVKDHAPFKGEVVLQTYAGLISLSNPNNTWGYAHFDVEILLKGRKLILEVV